MNLLVVESATKAKTIKEFLKEDKEKWVVVHTNGHITDLPTRKHGISIKGDVYIPEWVTEDDDKLKIIKKIQNLVSEAKQVFIATDDDREGEKIADDLVVNCNIYEYHRIVFPEITKETVLSAIQSAREIDKNIVKAQTTRRMIDREVGYRLSNIIKLDFKKKRTPINVNIGVGRTISPALHILVDREKEIENFISEKLYKIYIDYIKDNIQFRLRFPAVFREESKEEMHSLLLYLGNKNHYHIVESYTPVTKEITPYPPLITSRMQKGAFYLFGFEPTYTMKLAQKLFETGLITYHRTDSYFLSDDFILKLIKYANRKYGKQNVLQSKRIYKNKTNSHNAHEAIRPTNVEISPDNISDNKLYRDGIITDDHIKLYNHVWSTTVATQMVNAVYDRSEVKVRVGDNILEGNANCYSKIFDPEKQEYVEQKGWELFFGNYLKTAEKDNDEEWKDQTTYLPKFQIGEELQFIDINFVETFTKTPPRFGIGRFITYLENKGIGRPSTYANIYKKLIDTRCVNIANNQMLLPSDIGIKIDNWLEENAPWVIDIDRASKFEECLDKIETGEIENPNLLIKEYSDLIDELQQKLNISQDELENKIPSEKQLDLYKKIVSKNNMNFSNTLAMDKKRLSEFIKKNITARERFSKCPICNQEVFYYNNNDPFIKCSNKSCDFFIKEKSFVNFFLRYGKQLSKKDTKKIIKDILSKKSGFTVKDLVSPKNNKTFSAKVSLKKDNNFWGLSLVF